MPRRDLTHNQRTNRSPARNDHPESAQPLISQGRRLPPPPPPGHMPAGLSTYSTYSLQEERVPQSSELPNPFSCHHPDSYYEGSSRRDSLLSLSYPNSEMLPKGEPSPFGGYPPSQFPLYITDKEADDYIHNPDPIADGEYDKNRLLYDLKQMDRQSFCNFVSLFCFGTAVFAVMTVVPILTFSNFARRPYLEKAEILTLYAYPMSSAIRMSLIDPDTPREALTKRVFNGQEWVLTFSDEFNAEGRTFYDGDDQFFQAVDLHYDATKDLEWYDPDAVTTANGTLQLKLDAHKNHDLFYRSGMVQSWNKLCFTQGAIDIAAKLPGYGTITGLWPGLWTMGNIGRPGYLSTTDGTWPYTYDSCDAGITPNQSSADGMSYLPGQRLNACTCPGEDHPNRGTGRGAPEIDIVEATIDNKNGVVSQSYQVAPFDIWYRPDYSFVHVYNTDISAMNLYVGGHFQQAVSCLTTLNPAWYELGDNAQKFQMYGYEYLHGNDDGYITWHVGGQPTFTTHSYALGPNGNVNFRRISKEPMTIIMNLGVSPNWSYIDWPALVFPSTMEIDYVRVYQPADAISMTCDPEGYPTTEYIDAHKEAYYNVNNTLWEDAGYSFPRNKLVHGC